jgi:hypothetical protein
MLPHLIFAEAPASKVVLHHFDELPTGRAGHVLIKILRGADHCFSARINACKVLFIKSWATLRAATEHNIETGASGSGTIKCYPLGKFPVVAALVVAHAECQIGAYALSLWTAHRKS